MEINEKYSFPVRSWTKRKSFVDVDSSEFNDTEIVGACFHQDEPYSDVFPKGVKNCLLTKCNVDNCNIPDGFTVGEGTTNKHFLIQNDGEYWLVDKDLKPIEPRDSDRFDLCGLSKDPANLPAEKLSQPITFTNDPKYIEQQKIEALKNDPARLKQVLISSGEIYG